MVTSHDITGFLQRAAAGDTDAFQRLYDATSSKLFGIILRILRRQDIAEDVLQEVYVTVWKRASSFDPSLASPITWMATIARNRAIDEVRRKSPMVVAPEDLAEMSDGTAALHASGHQDDMIGLMRCLEGLEPQRREMVLLAYFEGYSREAIAEKYTCPVNSVKTWLRRSLLQLRECLG